jgi:ubiquinone biosynthesis UbiH/UbiF/VisC/COQ6 family hydroxylase
MSELITTDVTIVGAGLVGLAAAVAMHKAGQQVVIVDAKSPPNVEFTNGDWDSRIYAISPRNANWLASIGVWQHIDAKRIGNMQAMEIIGDEKLAPIHLLADDANADYLGFIVESSALSSALLKQVDHLGITRFFNTPCESIATTEANTTLMLNDGQVIHSNLLIAADSSQSWVRQQLNVPMQQKPYAQSAIVANFKVEHSHSNTARQWFVQGENGKSSILAWLPLPNNVISIVWSTAPDVAAELLTLSADQFSAQVQAAGGSVLGDLNLIGVPAVFPLVLQKSDLYTQQSVVFMGDAAHKIHPMAGQGVNLGFRDVMDFVDILKSKNPYQSINDSALLKAYTRKRKVDMMKMVLLTDGLYQLFSSQNELTKTVRLWGFSATNHHVIKKMLVENAVAL